MQCRPGTSEITLLLCDGKSEEGDEGSHRQSWEKDANRNEELEAFEPGAPVVLEVHDVRDKGPECQNPCMRDKILPNKAPSTQNLS